MCVDCKHSLASSIIATSIDELMNEGKYERKIEDDEATKEARSSYASDPSFLNAMALGNALSFQMRYHEALGFYEKAKEMKPSDYSSHRKCAGRYFSTLQLEKAVEEFSWCLAHAIDKLDPLYMLGCVYYCKGDFPKSKEAFSQCLELAKDNADMYIGVLYWLIAGDIRTNGGYEEDIAKFDDSIKIGHHTGYFEALKLFKGVPIDGCDIDSEDEIQRCIFAYGAHLYFLSKNDEALSKRYLEKALSLDAYFASFAYLAAYSETHRI